MQSLIEKLAATGYNRDTVIEEGDFSQALEEMHQTDLSLAFLEHKKEPSYRDKRARKSLHLKDLTQLDMDEDYVAELERFNPEHHPVLHLLVDFPLWFWRNRVR